MWLRVEHYADDLRQGCLIGEATRDTQVDRSFVLHVILKICSIGAGILNFFRCKALGHYSNSDSSLH
jgi:hypothetical protein